MFHRTPGKTGGVQSAGFNAGGIYDFTDHYDFLLSLGKGLQRAYQECALKMRIELSGSSRSTARPFRHRFLFTPAILRDYNSFRSLARRWLGRLLPAPSPPRQCGRSVGERDRDHFDRPSRQKSAHPCGVFCCAIARMPERRPPRRADSGCICRPVCSFVPAAPCRPRNSGVASCLSTISKSRSILLELEPRI